MKLATLEKIVAVEKHPNADLLDVVQVLNYKAIVKRGEWRVGDLCVFIQPDSVLPDNKLWAEFYKKKSGRVKAIRLRGVWSFGIVESLANVDIRESDTLTDLVDCEGADVTEQMQVTKYEPPQPQDLQAKGLLPFNIPKTDETRWQGIRNSDMPYGELCDVTLKIDGQSFSAFYRDFQDGDNGEPAIKMGVLGRTMEYKLDADNNYTKNEKQHNVLHKLASYCVTNKINLCVRAESYGLGIQKFGHNPHCKVPLNLAFFSTWLIDENRYARKGEVNYIFDLAPRIGLPTVPVLERDVILTRELIQKYDEELEKLPNGDMFEGVVINWKGGSFKVINKHYDAKK